MVLVAWSIDYFIFQFCHDFLPGDGNFVMAIVTSFACVRKTRVLVGRDVLGVNCSLNAAALEPRRRLRRAGQEPGQGWEPAVRTPPPAQLGGKRLEALSLGVNCLLSKSLFFPGEGWKGAKNRSWQGLNERQLAYERSGVSSDNEGFSAAASKVEERLCGEQYSRCDGARPWGLGAAAIRRSKFPCTDRAGAGSARGGRDHLPAAPQQRRSP